MNDLISRQAAIRWVKTECNPYGKPTLDYESGKHVMKHLEQMPSSQPEQRWIQCSERLPDVECGESDIVLATCGYMNVKDTSVRWIKTLYFNGGNWCYPTGGTYEQKVYAWMPLPEPYGEDDHEAR